jgi:hypothetical protein
MFKTKLQPVLDLGFRALNLFRISRFGFRASARQRGATLIDAIVGTALMLLIFIGLFGVIRLAVVSVGLGKAKTGAIALANEQIEYIRSLPYNSVAVLGGIPAGSIPPEESISLNNIVYTRRTFVQFIDHAADGTGPSDTNGIQADFKIAKVSVSWQFRGSERDVALITNVVPKGIETLDGGGTLVVNVVDAGGAPVSNAEITITNTVVSPNISISTFSSNDGVAYFPGAPTSTAYQIETTKAGYSTDRTYLASPSNPNPMPGTLTVVGDTITSSTFRIDELSDITLRSFDEMRSATWTDTFADASLIEELQNTSVLGGEIILAGAPGTYSSSGSVTATSVAPVYLKTWGELSFDTVTSASTTVDVSVFAVTATSSSLVPDVDLPGNASGFASSPVDLSGLSAEEYPALALVGNLATNDSLMTPALRSWMITYIEGPIPRPTTSFTMQGAKTVGTDGGGAPIYKYTDSHTTGVDGTLAIDDVEWDTYLITKGAAESGLSVVEACPFQPFGLNPAISQIVDFIFAPATTHSLLVYVTNDQNVPLENASVRLTRTGYDETIDSSACGQSFFRGLSATTYTLDVSAAGFTTQNIAGLSVSGATTYSVLLNP